MTMRNLLVLPFLLGLAMAATGNPHTLYQRHQRGSRNKVRGTTTYGGVRNGRGPQRRLMMDEASSTDEEEEEYDYKEPVVTSNVFVHPSVNAEAEGHKTMQVECGSPESPFLTTFVTSLEFRETPLETSSSSGSKSGSKSGKSSKKSTKTKSGKGTSSLSSTVKTQKSSGKGKGKSGSKYADHNSSGDGFYVDLDEGNGDLPEEVPRNELTVSEQRVLQQTFRDVYNHLTFYDCDGFFRTVYTATMTLAERDDVDLGGTYEVTLPRPPPPQHDFDEEDEGDNNDDLGENDQERQRRRLPEEIDVDSTDEAHPSTIMDTSDLLEEEEVGSRLLSDGGNSTDGDRKPRQGSGFWGAPENYDNDGTDDTASAAPVDPRTVVGDDFKTIYYVTLASTCRNCEVTPEVHFPLLMIPEVVVQEEQATVETRQAASPTAAPTVESTIFNSTAPEEDVCTCPVGSDVSYERRKQRQRRSRRLDGNELYVPPPYAPTAEEFVAAVNEAIRQTPILNRRLLGLVQLVEPDYFSGQNPKIVMSETPAPTFFVPATSSPSPSVAPLTRPPRTPSPTQPNLVPDTPTEESTAAVSQQSLAALATVLLSMLCLLW
jgi:hypothetical protein